MFSRKTEEIRPIFPRLFPYTLGIFPKWSGMGVGKAGNLETPFLLCIFAPGVEKTGWKFQAAGG